MKQRIIFGRKLEGGRSPAPSGLGRARLGPRGLLETLELHAGLWRPPVAAIERQAAFLALLRGREGNLPSFAESLAADPFAAACRLLEWLDLWRLHGWSGRIPDEAPPRLAELAWLAREAESVLPPSEGARLEALRAAIAGGNSPPIEAIELLEPLEEQPAAWRRVLSLLPCVARPWAPAADPESDLGRLQRYLQAGSGEGAATDKREAPDGPPAKPAPLPAPRGDGSLVLQRSGTRLGAARELADRMPAADPPGEGAAAATERLALIGDGGRLLDDCAAGLGRPRPACGASSSTRPALQILPLALAVRREPVDLEGILAFLTHPLSPLGHEGRSLAKAVAADAGLGGPAWEEAWKKAKKRIEERGYSHADFAARVETWLPHRREPEGPLDPALLASAAEELSASLRARRFAPTASARPDPEQAAALALAAAHCALFAKSLRALGDSRRIPLRLAEELLSASAAALSGDASEVPELGSLPWATHPASLAEPVDELLWFLPEPPSDRDAWPWTFAELASLAAEGLELPDLAVLAARDQRDWIRAVCLVRRRLELVLPPKGSPLHPLALLVERVHGSGLTATIPENRLLEKAEPVERLSLPAPKRWWKLPSGITLPEDWSGSYSQLEIFLKRPAQWVLKYAARIETATILSVPERGALTGSFAHALVERLVKDHGAGAISLDGAAFDDWFAPVFEELLVSHGTRWLEAGAGQDRLRLRETLRRSTKALLGQLRAAKVLGIEAEKPLAGKLFGRPFTGSADLALTLGDGSPAFVDMKHSTWTAGYREKLEADKDLQLTVYAELLAQVLRAEAAEEAARVGAAAREAGAAPHGAYWLIPKETLLAREGSPFAGATKLPSRTSHEDRLARAERSFAWRLAQLAEGRIEVVCEATEASLDAAAAPEGGMALEAAHDGFDPYVALYGRGEEA